MAACPGCEQRELLLWHAARKLSGVEAALVGRALETCSRCREAFRLDRVLADSFRMGEVVSPEALVALAESTESKVWASGSPDLSHLDEVDREIVSILRAIQADEEQRERSFAAKLRRIPERVVEFLGWGRPALRPAWAYLLLLAMVYPAYRGIFLETSETGPTLLAQPIALGEPSRASSGAPGEADVLQSGTDAVITVFVPVDPANRYTLTIEHESGRILFRSENASPFDGIGTFAVLLPSSSLSSGNYEVRIEEIEAGAPPTPANTYRFTFTVE